MVFDTYLPQSFCREFVEAKNNSMQLGMYMSLVLGIKPLLDDWISVERMEIFRKACRKYRVHIRQDAIFQSCDKEEIPAHIIGSKYLTTTTAFGFHPQSGMAGQMHVFLSREKRLLKDAMWYPVIVKDRVLFQPRADQLNYGYTLGYPRCCVNFFRRFNDWMKYSYLYEAYRNTSGEPSFMCNPFLKDSTLSYIYHMPCSYNCKATIELVARLKKEINKREPAYVRIVERFLKRPFLVFYEKKIYGFEGQLKGNTVRYSRVYFTSPNVTQDLYSADFAAADSLRLEGRKILLWRGRRLVKVIEPPLNDFAPEYPFLIQF